MPLRQQNPKEMWLICRQRLKLPLQCIHTSDTTVLHSTIDNSCLTDTLVSLFCLSRWRGGGWRQFPWWWWCATRGGEWASLGWGASWRWSPRCGGWGRDGGGWCWGQRNWRWRPCWWGGYRDTDRDIGVFIFVFFNLRAFRLKSSYALKMHMSFSIWKLLNF